jgi:membrane associated rhomboid family serine protease
LPEETDICLEHLFILIGINLFVFISLYVRPDLLPYLALTPADVWSRPWQLITHMFTHREVLHIFANMYTLYFFGQVVLRLLGATRFWLVYLFGGITGGLFFIALAPVTGMEYARAIGASGAVFALAGVLVILYPQMRVMIFPIPVPMPLWVAILGGFVILSFLPNVAWQGHLGGLLFGAAAGYLFKRNQFRRWR